MPNESQSWQVELRAAPASDKLEIAIHDVIGSSFFEDGVTSKDFLAALRSAPKAKSIDLRVNSVGGIVDQAKGMGNLLAERAASGVTITGYVDGIAASAASYLLTFAQRVVMPANTFQMLHEARGGVRGTAKEAEAYAALLRRTTGQIAEAYAAASARRGKDKTKEDFLALFAEGDTYLDADEAIEWGLADEKLEPLKVAACLVDLGDRAESAPEAVKSAPYVGKPATPSAKQGDVVLAPVSVQGDPAEVRAAVKREMDRFFAELPAATSKSNPSPTSARPTNNKEIHMDQVIQALALGEGADEAAIVAAVKKLQVSARIGGEIEKLVGATGDSALGAVRALKEAQAQQVEQAAEIGKIKASLARRDFETARDGGLKDKKLTPAVAKHYSDRFESALASGDGYESIVADLQGFLAVAPRLVSSPGVAGGTAPVTDGPMQHGGKAFEQLTAMEQHRLKVESREIYDALREDAVNRGAL